MERPVELVGASADYYLFLKAAKSCSFAEEVANLRQNLKDFEFIYREFLNITKHLKYYGRKFN